MNITSSMIVYNPQKDTWKSVAPMPTARERLKLVASGRYLYAVGGLAPDGPSLTTVERYDPKSDSWRTLSPMRESRALSCVVETTVGKRRVLVAVAGVQIPPGDARRTTEVYDIKADRWTLLDARLTVQRGSNDCATESNGTVLTIGGVSMKNGQRVFLSDVEALTIRPRDLSSR
jgi:N-acetylneuraminic acid mutarotase